MRFSSRMRCAELARIIGVLLMTLALGACSTVRLGYNNLPEISYWWLDAYVDFNGAQTPPVRDALAELLAWHRREELPRIDALLQDAQALAPGEITPAQVCTMYVRVRERLLAAADHAEPAATELALSLTGAQLQTLERKYAKNDAAFRKDWLDRTPAQVQEKRYDQYLDRIEDFYGRLGEDQRELLRQQVARSVFDPRLLDNERRKRQQEALALLRGFVADKAAPADARAALHAFIRRIAEPPPGPWRDQQQAILQEGCNNLAALHNGATPSQRAQAVRRLQSYRDDLHALMARR